MGSLDLDEFEGTLICLNYVRKQMTSALQTVIHLVTSFGGISSPYFRPCKTTSLTIQDSRTEGEREAAREREVSVKEVNE